MLPIIAPKPTHYPAFWLRDDVKRDHRWGMPLDGCPAGHAIKGGHERNALGVCRLCGSGPLFVWRRGGK
jgi:hypothetical protein